MNWLAHFFGLDNGSGPQYLFWSGIGSDITEVAILGGMIQLYRRHNCHVRGCFRVGMRHYGDALLCKRHHPNPDPTHEEILANGPKS